MNLIYFIRLLLKNVYLIIGVGILMAVLVYMMTRNQPETYSSDMVIYTGLATGINIESGSDARYDLFGTNAAFDNLLNIIRSRQTQEETAIRLMAQHLMLEQPDPRYCTKATWDAIHNEAPMDLKALVHYDPSYLSDEGYELQRAGNDVREDSQNEQETPGAYDTVQTKTISETRYESRQVTEKVKKFRTEPK